MARTSGYPLADRALDGRLADLLLGWDAEGLSLFDIALKLRDDHDLEVSPSTVSRWKEIARADRDDTKAAS